jgi:hypothetical protein
VVHAPDGVPGMCGRGWEAGWCDEDALHSPRYDHQLCSQDKVRSADNWDSVKAEICLSNIMQRDNVLFARKLSKDLVKLAKEKNKYVSGFFLFQKSSFWFNKAYLCIVPVFIYPP